MTDKHPITPPPELVGHWLSDVYGVCTAPGESSVYIATRAAQWGADRELEACCEWLHWQNLATHSALIPSLRAARRPNPPSLKEQALALINECTDPEGDYLDDNALSIIRRALEALPGD
jgi:hypothetical protein